MIKVQRLKIPEVMRLETVRYGDERGYFQQTYHKDEYSEAGINDIFVQDNWSYSRKGTLRGLHYQLKRPQAKIITVVRGEIYDVAVDIRLGSPTFGQWVGSYISRENGYQMYIPEGFAHGFCTLSDEADVIYKSSDLYDPDDEYAVNWSDQTINIEWPLDQTDYLLSAKDEKAPCLTDIPRENLPGYR